MQNFDCSVFNDLNAERMSSPTCKDLGIPRECEEVSVFSSRLIRNQALHLDGLRYDAVVNGTFQKADPFAPVCMIPLPFNLQHLEPCFVRKRNERERERVRCVNDGYTRLKEHLPLENKSKRISKVETLRKAIEYIRYLESVLAEDGNSKSDHNSFCDLVNFDDSSDNVSTVSDNFSHEDDSEVSVCDSILSESDTETEHNTCKALPTTKIKSCHRKRSRSSEDDIKIKTKRQGVHMA